MGNEKSYRSAKIRAASYDEKANTIEVVWSTGADVERCDWNGESYVERLSMDPAHVRLDRLNAGASFLDSHDSFGLCNVIGSVVPGSARIEGGEGLATIRLSSAAGDADTIGKIRDGVIRSVSVGYLTHKSVRDDSGDMPVETATDWEPLEVSAVAVPADPGAQIRSASGRRRRRSTMTPEQMAYANGAAIAARALGKPTPASGFVEIPRAAQRTTGLDKDAYEAGARAMRRTLRRTGHVGGKA